MEKSKLVIKSISEIIAELIWNYDQESVDALKQIVQIVGITEFEFSDASAYSVSLRKNFQGSHEQQFFVEFVLAKPFLFQVYFSVVSCSNNLQKVALKFTKDNLKKSITINTLSDVRQMTDEFREHFEMVEQLFTDLEKLRDEKTAKSQDGKLSILKQDIIFVIPSKFRSFEKSNYWGILDH
ncbi:MAG: hypothetical protein ACD_9C00095G0002 [uncultured bacterium]|nr:MAG: hypothetical protein ACD_9C00095G0002 [uncultured bacterium]